MSEVAGDAEYDERVCGWSWACGYFAGAVLRSWWPPNSRRIADSSAVRELVVVARGEAREQSGCQNGHGHAGLDGRVHGPAALAGVGNLAEKLSELGVAAERGRGDVEQPRTDDAAVAP